MMARSRRAPVVTLTVYLFALMTMATIGVIVPFVRPMATALHASAPAIGFGIALFSVPSAILATLGGALLDRVGPRAALITAGLVTILGDAILINAGGSWTLDAGLLIDGIGMPAIVIAGPALLMAALDGTVRTRALSFFSTYAPTGFALGLLMAIPFAARSGWRTALLAHLVLAVGTSLLGLLLLPKVERPIAAHRDACDEAAHSTGTARIGLGGLRRYAGALRLGVGIALPNAIAYGTSLAAPSYLAKTDGVSIAASAGAVAAAKIIALLIGGLITGQILARRSPPWTVFATMAALGVAAQMLFFLPTGSLAVAIAALVLWLFAFGGMSGVAMSMLPVVAPEPTRRAATTGLVNQMISLVCFATPSTYFALHGWWGFVGLAVAGLFISTIALPMVRLEARA